MAQIGLSSAKTEDTKILKMQRYKGRSGYTYVLLGRRMRNCMRVPLTLIFFRKAGRGLDQDSALQIFPLSIPNEREGCTFPRNLKS